MFLLATVWNSWESIRQAQRFAQDLPTLQVARELVLAYLGLERNLVFSLDDRPLLRLPSRVGSSTVKVRVSWTWRRDPSLRLRRSPRRAFFLPCRATAKAGAEAEESAVRRLTNFLVAAFSQRSWLPLQSFPLPKVRGRQANRSSGHRRLELPAHHAGTVPLIGPPLLHVECGSGVLEKVRCPTAMPRNTALSCSCSCSWVGPAGLTANSFTRQVSARVHPRLPANESPEQL